MRVVFTVLCFAVLTFSSPVYAEDVTSEILSIEDVTPMLQNFVNLKPGQRLLEVYGISQLAEYQQAKIFFQYMKAGRGGAKPSRGELNCYKLNSGKWYCGGVYSILTK